MIVATNNSGKIKEIRKIFSDYEIYSLKDRNINIDVFEDTDTFYGNALKKAREIYELTKEPTIADDSGLCIKELDGFPGVLTHRFMGEDVSDYERNNELIRLTNNIRDRSAKVVCVMVYYDGVDTLVGEGIIDGKIANDIRGENGFGFDSVFELDDGRTLAELTDNEKNMISARYLALMDIKREFDKMKIREKIRKC